ncbi:transposase [Winogradskyella sp.]|uniref:transposase n=1 Tax=Winogradskyella sp. TaxID=1883156 RepID=UPI003703ADE4
MEVLGIPRSSFYYKPKQNKRRGIAKSTHTQTRNGSVVSNETVVKDIEYILSKEFVDYGYLKVTYWLRQQKDYIINPKKVYRLMREQGLLNKVVPRKKNQRNWVKELVPPAEDAFDYLEFDIKYFYVAGKNRNALSLTIIDVKSRWVLGHYTAWTIKKEDVIELFDQLFEAYSLPKSFYVRNDNGSQFVAEKVQQYFEDKGITQEFCKPATPEQNAHIESYHSIQEKVICQRNEFASLEQLRETLNRFVSFYNFNRIHSGVGYTSPYKYLLNMDLDMNQFELDQALDCQSNQVYFFN